MEPYPGSFIPFGDGETQYPGGKFAQAEPVGELLICERGRELNMSLRAIQKLLYMVWPELRKSFATTFWCFFGPNKLGFWWINKGTAERHFDLQEDITAARFAPQLAF